MPLKIGITGLALTALFGTGVLMWSNAEPNSQTVAESKDGSYSGKFGEDFKHHMVSATNADNDAWWNWSFAKRWSNNETNDSSFAGVDSGESLKSKCKDAYDKKTKDDMRGQDKDSYEKTVWRYCSLEGKRPVTVKDAKDKSGTSNSGKMAEAHESDLISTKDLSNSRFWEIQEKAFFGTGGLREKASNNSAFKDLDGTKGIKLRDKCQEVYEKATNNGENDKKDLLAFCSLNPSKE